MKTKRIRRIFMSLMLFASMVLGACATDDEPAEEESLTPTEEAEASTVDVTGTDFAFSGIPDTIEAGSTLTFTNASTVEVHELVAFKLPESETRTAAELFQLPEAELNAVLAGEPAFVQLQPPGGELIQAVGDGTLEDAGRYVFACFIGTGVDPAAYMAALQTSQGGPVTIPGSGPPHFVKGMFAQATVE